MWVETGSAETCWREVRTFALTGVTSLSETTNFQFTLRWGGVATGTSAPVPGHSDSVEALNQVNGGGVPLTPTHQGWESPEAAQQDIITIFKSRYNNIAFCLVLEETQQFFKGPTWCKIVFTNVFQQESVSLLSANFPEVRCHREHHYLTDALMQSFYYQCGQRQSSYCNKSTFFFF